jgi:hypothetical protein
MAAAQQKIDINFPQSSMPGRRPGEGQGRLVNCFCEVDGGIKTWRTVPGLKLFADIGAGTPRGMIVRGQTLYVAALNTLKTITPFGDIATVSGSLDGYNPVTMAVNNRQPTPDMVIVSELDVYNVTSTLITPLGQPSLPQPNSVAAFDGYFMFTTANGLLYASDLNNTTIDALSFTPCQADPDGLLRGISYGSVFYAMGPNSIEAYTDAGTSPFPLVRSGVIQVGLLGQWAVAGFGSGWNANPFFVASDSTVRRIDGYAATIVSIKDVERDIKTVANKSLIRMSQHVVGGHSIITISAPTFTWEYNANTQFWHERKSFSQQRWRAEQSVLFSNRWIVGDMLSSNLLEITEDAQDENGDPLEFWIESAPVKQFPEGVQAYTGFFDWTVGVGDVAADDSMDALDPTLSVSISKDGGGAWTEVAERSLGRLGEYNTLVRVNRMAGTSSHHGLRVRLVVASPVYRTFRGARMSADMRPT